MTVQVAERGLWFPYPRGKRNSFSALAKWLEVTQAACSAIPPAIITVAMDRVSPQVEQAPYMPIRGIPPDRPKLLAMDCPSRSPAKRYLIS